MPCCVYHILNSFVTCLLSVPLNLEDNNQNQQQSVGSRLPCMSKLTKIVATIGPATESEDTIRQLITAGMNVARFNTKHSEPDWHNERVQRVRKIAEEMQKPVGILLDLQGPEIRINLLEEKSFELGMDEVATFTSDKNPTQPKSIIVPPSAIEALAVGSTIIVGDGACEFEVVEHGEHELKARALFACTVNHRKTMNTPGITPNMPSLTERDFAYLDGIRPELIDFVGLSFVRNQDDISHLRGELEKRHFTAHIVAKIENQQAVDNLDQIIHAADAVMVARGDLGVEVAFQELTYWQKTIIAKCRLAAKPVITATEMLKSMVTNPRPTRAEVSDVAHAIYDGTDAVMLSDETTVGKYPVKAVSVQTRIAEFNEQHTNVHLDPLPTSTSQTAVTQSAIELLESSNFPIDRIICLTETGSTALLLARFRPHIPIHALTPDVAVYRRLSLVFGVAPYLVEHPGDELTEESLMEMCLKAGITASGEHILLVRGKFVRQPGITNTLSVIDVP